MKRILVLFAVAALVTGVAFADETVLIDFSKLVRDILQDKEAEGLLPQNKQTVMDFSSNAGNSFTPEQRAVMKTSLAIENWNVQLAQSSVTVLNRNLSFTKTVASKQHTNVLGVRVHFPVANYNSYAKVVPPFEIPAYEFGTVADDGSITRTDDMTGVSRFENGYGVLKNVGAVKAIAVEAYGLNFPCSLYAIIQDGAGQEQVVFMGALTYDGWATLRWDNPQYIQDVRNRTYKLTPLYPTVAPYIKFGGFIIQRDAANADIVDRDFVTYFKEVRVIYDKAELDADRDIKDEEAWKIIETRELDKAKNEGKDFGKEQVFRYLETRKQAKEDAFQEPGSAGTAAPQQ